MEFQTHGNGNGLNDLYILPDSDAEAGKIRRFLRRNGRLWHWSVSDVEGQPWYGRTFFEIPFGESLQVEIENLSEEA